MKVQLRRSKEGWGGGVMKQVPPDHIIIMVMFPVLHGCFDVIYNMVKLLVVSGAMQQCEVRSGLMGCVCSK